jgi:S-adenosylmethionine-diacylgycerolhomoserine-N-methlytransferase
VLRSAHPGSLVYLRWFPSIHPLSITVTAAKMDAIYRFQRHLYDLTRKHYLLGRDTLICELAVPDEGSVLEIGCGTARNLIHAARMYPTARCFGVDISSVMLKTAQESIGRNGLLDRVIVKLGDGAAFDSDTLFDTSHFDRVMISYALSMIPAWEDVLSLAANLVAPNGSVHIADFGDQARLPGWFCAALRAWLSAFSVTPRLNLGDKVNQIASEHDYVSHCRAIYRGYAVLAEIHAR